jgi:hypothetical protein
MAKNINVEEAASWSKEEAQANLKYLSDRLRWKEHARALELRDESAPEEEEPTDEVEETTDEETAEEESVEETEEEPAEEVQEEEPKKSRRKRKG